MDLLYRFLIGGAVVSLFSGIGEMARPKTYAGVFGVAPSVALATLALTFAHGDLATVHVEARWMLVGCVAMLAYCVACVAACRRERVPVWAGAAGSWLCWVAVAIASWLALAGVLR